MEEKEFQKKWLRELAENVEEIDSALSDIAATQDTLNKAYARLHDAIEETPYAIGHVELLKNKDFVQITAEARELLQNANNSENLTSKEVEAISAKAAELASNLRKLSNQ